MMLINFLSDLIATVLGGTLLALIFFWVREKFFPLPNITGRWYFESKTETTSYVPYSGMILRYVALLWNEGQVIRGTVEKIYEDSSTGQREYVGKNRTRGKVNGFIKKNYFSADRIFLHIVEDGHGRESTNVYDLLVSKQGFSGIFQSMVANQTGHCHWKREKI